MVIRMVVDSIERASRIKKGKPDLEDYYKVGANDGNGSRIILALDILPDGLNINTVLAVEVERANTSR